MNSQELKRKSLPIQEIKPLSLKKTISFGASETSQEFFGKSVLDWLA